MRKVIMGVGTFLVVVGLIQLILSVALIGGVKGQVEEIDPLIEDAADMLTKVADSVDRGAAFLGDLDPRLAALEETIGDTIDDSTRQIGDLDASLADAEGDVADALDGTLRFLDDLDTVLAEVEKPLGVMDDTVRYLGGLDANLAVVEERLVTTVDGGLRYLGNLDTALADADGVAAATIDGTLRWVRELGDTLDLVDGTVTEITASMILTRDSTTEMLEQLGVVEIRAEDLQQLVAPVVTVLADAERTVAGMTASVEAIRDATNEFLEQRVLGIWPEDFEAWAQKLEALLGWDAGLRDWAAYIGTGWQLFPLEASPEGLISVAVLLEGAGLDATWIRDEAARLEREGLIWSLTPEDVAGAFTPAIYNLELASTALSDASGWLTYWPDFLQREDLALRMFPVEMTADDVDAWADHVEAAGLDAAWIRAEADRLRRDGLMWSLTPQDFARAFAPVIDSLELALDSLSDTSEYLGTLQTSLTDLRKLAVDNIAGTREFLGVARTSLEATKGPAIDSISEGRKLLRTARTSLADAKGPIADGLAGSRAALQATETSVAAARSPVLEGIAGTRELLGTARTSLGDLKQPALDGISDIRGYLQTAQADLGGLGDGLRTTSEGIVGLGIGGMIGGMIGWLQWFMILMSILFMAAGVGLFLLGMKKEES